MTERVVAGFGGGRAGCAEQRPAPPLSPTRLTSRAPRSATSSPSDVFPVGRKLLQALSDLYQKLKRQEQLKQNQFYHWP